MTEPAEVHMRDSDAFSWYMEQDPLLRSTVVAVIALDRSPDWDCMLDRLERASRLSPGFRHRVVSPPFRLATPRWVADTDFDLSWHVRRFDAAAPKTLATVIDFARKTGMAGFDRDRPLWEFTLVEGLADGGAALVMKLHHALTDGIGGMELAHFLFDVEREGSDPGPMPPAPEGERLGPIDLVRDALVYDCTRLVRFTRRRIGAAFDDVRHAMTHPVETVTGAAATIASIGRTVEPVNDTLSPVMRERHLSWHYDVLEFPLDAIQDAARTAGATLNDAFLAAIAAGLRTYHERHGVDVEELRVTMPISIRGEDDPIGGNRITLMRFKVPVALTDPAKRMAEIHARCGEIKTARSLPHTDAIAGTLNLLPRAVLGGMLKHVDFLASNVPGIPVPLYLAGAKVTRFYGFGPTIGAALNLTLISYGGRCYVGVNSDTGAVPDGDLMLECLRDGVDEVLTIGGHPATVDLPTR